VQVGSDPNASPRYYYVYNGHGDVVALVDASGNTVASYAYDAFGQLTAASENFGSGTTWTNSYRYDGRDGVRYDGETGFYWMSVRAYDPTLGRFLSRDPLGRVPLFFADQPYVYGGNNPLINVDPSGQFMATEGVSNKQAHAIMKQKARIYWTPPRPRKGWNGCYEGDVRCQGAQAQRDAQSGFNKISNFFRARLGGAVYDWLTQQKLPLGGSLNQFFNWIRTGAGAFWAMISGLKNLPLARFSLFIFWAMADWEVHQSKNWFQSVNNIAAFGRAVIKIFQDAIFVPAGILAVSGFATEDVSLLLMAYAYANDATTAYGVLYDSVVYSQVMEFFLDPWVYTNGGGHSNVR
jgi:RHS repeat-associated protein